MLTYENIKKTLNEQEDEILVKIHNKYCEEKDKMYLYIYNNTPDNVEMLLPEQRYECLLEGQYIRDTYIQSDKWVQMDEQGHIISENEAKGTLYLLLFYLSRCKDTKYNKIFALFYYKYLLFSSLCSLFSIF